MWINLGALQVSPAPSTLCQWQHSFNRYLDSHGRDCPSSSQVPKPQDSDGATTPHQQNSSVGDSLGSAGALAGVLDVEHLYEVIFNLLPIICISQCVLADHLTLFHFIVLDACTGSEGHSPIDSWDQGFEGGDCRAEAGAFRGHQFRDSRIVGASDLTGRMFCVYLLVCLFVSVILIMCLLASPQFVHHMFLAHHCGINSINCHNEMRECSNY